MMNDEYFQLRRRSFIAFYLLLGIHVGTSFDIVTPVGVEVLATFPMCTLCIAFTTFMMLSSAYFGRKHHLHFFLWFVLLQYPAAMIIIHMVNRFTGKYIRIFTVDDLLFDHHGELHVIFVGRLAFLAIVVVCFLFMICMLIDAYLYYRNQQKSQITEERRKVMRRDEILDIAIYAVLLIMMMVDFLFPLIIPHIITNVLMTGMVGRTYYVYTNFLRYSEHTSRKRAAFMYIEKQICSMIKQERANPIYQSNSTLENVADALGVDRGDLSDYLYEELHTTFPSWMSEKKITHFASQLLLTDRKINELAVACGYTNATSVNRAFKMRFDMTPTEYRDKNKGLED